MPDVFISYATPDRDRARVLAIALEARGWSVWWDRKIIPGQTFDQVIERELESASNVVVLWSDSSISSDWVKGEAAVAAERGVLVPALIARVRLPLEFRRKQTADLIGWKGDRSHAGFVALCEALTPPENVAKVSSDAPAGSKWAGLQRGRRRMSVGVAVIVFAMGSGAYWSLVARQPAVKRSAEADKSVPLPKVQERLSASGSPPPHIVRVRVALVIGNGTYRNHLHLDLPGATVDAEAIGAKLASKGFQILYRENVARDDLIATLHDFRTLLAQGGVGLVYYAGYAIRLNNADYMIPVDAPAGISRANVEEVGVNVTAILRPIEKIIATTPGSSGDVIVYAAAEGQTALDSIDGHSPFTHSVLEVLDWQSSKLSDLFEYVSAETAKRSRGIQTPVLTTSFNQSFNFNDPVHDKDLGILKIVLFDACRVEEAVR